MNRFLKVSLTAALVVALFAGGLALQDSFAQTDDAEPAAQRTVTVNGVGQVSAMPDSATVSVGVETQAETAAEALAQNNEQMQSVIDALEEAGVASEDIQTQTINLQPRYGDQPEPQVAQAPEVVGYSANNVVQVRVDDLDSLGELLDTAVQAGGNTIQGIGFQVSDPGDLLDQAREAAVQDARTKAEQLASLVDADLGQVLSITETSRGPAPFGRGGAVLEQAAVPVEPGSQNISVDVSVTWLLE